MLSSKGSSVVVVGAEVVAQFAEETLPEAPVLQADVLEQQVLESVAELGCGRNRMRERERDRMCAAYWEFFVQLGPWAAVGTDATSDGGAVKRYKSSYHEDRGDA